MMHVQFRFRFSQNTNFSNPVSTVQFLRRSTTVQLLQSSFDSPIFTIQSRTSISHKTQGVSKYFFEKKVSGIFILKIFNEKLIMHSIMSHFKSTDIIFTMSNRSYS